MRLFSVATGILAIIGLIYVVATRERPVPGLLTTRQEMAIGRLASAALVASAGGLDSDPDQAKRLAAIGNRIVKNSVASESPYAFSFHVLDDAREAKVASLPDGEIFLTDALLAVLTDDTEIAALLAHAVGHVVAHHPAAHLVASGLEPRDGDGGHGAAVQGLVTLQYSVTEERAADQIAVRLLSEAGYDPEVLAEALKKLDEARDASRGFFAEHPNPPHRISRVRAAIADIRKSEDPGKVAH